MTLKEKLNMGEVSAYETPSLKTLEVRSEGVLCMSSPDSTIDNGHEDDWGTL